MERTYMLIGYRANAVDTCRGCVMEREGSDNVMEVGLYAPAVAGRAAKLLEREGLGSYDVVIIDSCGHVVYNNSGESLYWNDPDEDPLAKDLTEVVDTARDAIIAERVLAKRALNGTSALRRANGN